MQARILFVTDLHKRDTDFTTVVGYTSAIDRVQEDLLNFIKNNGVTHLILGGDWYDKGYRSINRTFNDHYYDEALAHAVNGNVYLCRGNHLYLERDSNPEMYLIQPCREMPLAKSIKMPEEQLFKTPPYVQIGPVQISLFHFHKEDKTYVRERNPETKFHVGVFHDDCVLPSSVRQISGDIGYTTTSSLAYYYSNLDLAVCNHIHMAVGRVDIQLTEKKVPAYIPGSLCITRNKQNELHSSVQLPLLTIEDDDSVKLQLATFSLHMEMLKLYNKKEATMSDKSVAYRPSQEVQNAFSEATAGVAGSLREALIRKRYSPEYLQIVNEAYYNDLDVRKLLNHINNGG